MVGAVIGAGSGLLDAAKKHTTGKIQGVVTPMAALGNSVQSEMLEKARQSGQSVSGQEIRDIIASNLTKEASHSTPTNHDGSAVSQQDTSDPQLN